MTDQIVQHGNMPVKRYALIDTENQFLVGHSDLIGLFPKENGDTVIQMRVVAEGNKT